MVCTTTVKKEVCCSTFLVLICVGFITIIALILSSCSFTNSKYCPSYHKHDGFILTSEVGSQYDYGYGDIRYFRIEKVLYDNLTSCVRVSSSSYNEYNGAFDSLPSIGSETTLYTDSSSYGCMDRLPNFDNTGLIILVVLLFFALFIMIYFTYQRINKTITVYNFVNMDLTNYSALNTSTITNDDEI